MRRPGFRKGSKEELPLFPRFQAKIFWRRARSRAHPRRQAAHPSVVAVERGRDPWKEGPSKYPQIPSMALSQMPNSKYAELGDKEERNGTQVRVGLGKSEGQGHSGA